MKPQSNKKRNMNKTNVKQAARIIFLLKVNNITQKNLAEELKVSLAAINRVINGKCKSQRISSYIKERLGV